MYQVSEEEGSNICPEWNAPLEMDVRETMASSLPKCRVGSAVHGAVEQRTEAQEYGYLPTCLPACLLTVWSGHVTSQSS